MSDMVYGLVVWAMLCLACYGWGYRMAKRNIRAILGDVLADQPFPGMVLTHREQRSIVGRVFGDDPRTYEMPPGIGAHPPEGPIRYDQHGWR